jgi:thioredoxin
MLTVIKFFADWCGPCKAMQPTWEKLQEELKDEVIFSSIDIDANSQIRAEYGIRSIPTFVLIEDGEEVDRKNGSMTYTEMKEWLEGDE